MCLALWQHPCPLRHGFAVPPPLVGEALAFRDVFQQTPVGFIENETSLPRAPTLGELARQRLRGQARQNKTRKHSDTMSLTNRACIAVFFAFCQHPCPLRLLRRHLSQSERLWHSVTFSSKRKSVSSKTKPLCQGLSLWESWRRRRLRGQARQNKTRKHSDTMSLTSRVRIAVCLALWQHPCPLRLLRRHLSQRERLWHSARSAVIARGS